MMGMFGREAATLHFSIGYHQNHLTASFNLNQLELYTMKILIRIRPNKWLNQERRLQPIVNQWVDKWREGLSDLQKFNRRMFPSGNTQRVQALLLTE